MDSLKYRALSQNTRNYDITTNDQLLNVGLGLGEAGEIQNLIKKLIFHGHDEDTIMPKLIDEAGDVLYYLDWLAEILGMSLSDFMEYNINKLARRYPDGFSHDASKYRMS